MAHWSGQFNADEIDVDIVGVKSVSSGTMLAFLRVRDATRRKDSSSIWSTGQPAASRSYCEMEKRRKEEEVASTAPLEGLRDR